MKKIFSIITILMFLLTINVFADTANPGDPGSEPTGGDLPIGGGAPIGSGSFILIGLAAAYGSKKLYDFNKNKKELED